MSQLKELQHLKIPFKEIEVATKNFETCIGKGGYGRVYKGELSISGKHTMVAVKRLDEQFGQGLKQFLTEIQLLSGQKHPNLISLLGYCDEGTEKIIVYEYAERGSLDRYLRRSNTTYNLTWQERLKICIHAARGLEHLHSHVGKHQTIIHRDIKSANILIDVNWVAKISDLGLSKLSLADLNRSAVISLPCGTPGYFEPEYIGSHIVKKESDVYSFGIVLFEVLCGRLCAVEYDDDFLLSALLAKDCYEKNKLDEIVDPSLSEQMNSYSKNKFSAIAYACLEDERKKRPAMDVVTKELEETLSIQKSDDILHLKHANEPKESNDILDLKYADEPEINKIMSSIKKIDHLKIRLEDIKSATKNFDKSNLISRGGFGKVYRGKLLLSQGLTMVAVKRLASAFGQGAPEFWEEIMVISYYKHENIVSLLGFCDESGENILVYEYLSNKSLDLYLSSTDLSWNQRLHICIGAARGLRYLHDPEETQYRVLHRDIKSANILLDQNWKAKISDFGLSKFGPANQQFTYLVSNAVGTMGYCDPLYWETGYLTKESDVYSFGVVLFEVLCGRLCIQNYENIHGFLARLAKERYEEKKLDTIIYSSLKKQISPECLERFSTIAYQCLMIDRRERPSMAKIVEELEIALEYQMQHEEIEGFENLSISDDDVYWEKKLPNDYQRHIQRTDKPLHYTSKKELYFLLCAGILCYRGTLWFSLCKSTGGICSMLPATDILRDDDDYERLDTLSLSESRFSEVKKLESNVWYRFTCSLRSTMFSPQNIYACYLVFKFADNDIQPVDTRLFHGEYKLDGIHQGTLIFAPLNLPPPMNIPTIKPKNDYGSHDSSNIPRIEGLRMPKGRMEHVVDGWMEQREDGWMEVMLCKSLHHYHYSLEVILKSKGGAFNGIIVEGMEFRPMQGSI